MKLILILLIFITLFSGCIDNNIPVVQSNTSINITNNITQSTTGITSNITTQQTRAYFLHDDNSTGLPYTSKDMRLAFDPGEPLEFTNYSNIPNGNTTIQNFTSPIMNISFVPHGIHTLHLHALKIGSGGSHVLKLFYDCGTVNSTGYNLSIKGTSEFSPEISSVLHTEVDLDMMMPDENINLTDRMFVRIWSNQVGSGNLPNLQLQYDDLTDSRLEFPILNTFEYQNGLLKSITS